MAVISLKRVIAFVLALIAICGSASAHSGRTDSSGGHNSSSGYHYHHGYPAHKHTNGYCPYGFDDKTGQSSGSGGGGGGGTVPGYARTIIPKGFHGKIEVGQCFEVSYTLFPENASDKYVDITSSNKKVARVEHGDTITGVGVGDVQITFTASGGASTSLALSVIRPSEDTIAEQEAEIKRAVSNARSALLSRVYWAAAGVLGVFAIFALRISSLKKSRKKLEENSAKLEKRLVDRTEQIKELQSANATLEKEKSAIAREKLQVVSDHKKTLSSLYESKTIDDIAPLPAGTSLTETGKPVSTGVGKYGDLYTVFCVRDGVTYHSRKGCSGADCEINVTDAASLKPCMRCAKKLPDLSWLEKRNAVLSECRKYGVKLASSKTTTPSPKNQNSQSVTSQI